MTSPNFSLETHVAFMAKAIQLAKRGMYSCKPNPRVGCVLVKDGLIIGEGWHEKAGEEHAEVMALRSARENNPSYIAGCTAYVTLEPCCHTGKTPPCVDALIKAEVGHVVIAMLDPNPKVSGNGVKLLEQAKIKVTQNILQDEALKLNPGFIKRMSQNLPYVRLKMAASLDGKTALNNQSSKWLTSSHSRADVHNLRAKSSAVLTGIGTVLADNPKMNVRLDDAYKFEQPLRVVLDSHLQISADANILKTNGDVLIVTTAQASEEKAEQLRNEQTEVISLSENTQSQVDLQALMSVLAEAEINELLVECGSTLAGAFLKEGLVDELVLYLAPHLIGAKAISLFDMPELEDMQERLDLQIEDMRLFEKDIRIIAKPIYH